ARSTPVRRAYLYRNLGAFAVARVSGFWHYPGEMKLSDLAAALGCALQGDGSLEITGVAGMEHATPSELTFLANPKYAPRVAHTRAGAILTAAPLEGIAAPQLLSANPYLDFARAL